MKTLGIVSGCFRGVLALAAGIALVGLERAHAQPTFSVDFQGPLAGAAPGLPWTEGDIFTPIPPGLLPPPAVAIPAPALGIIAGATGFAEVDALSFGTDLLLRQNQTTPLGWTFSVDEFAVGLPGLPGPSVTTEGAAGLMEASADIYASFVPPFPVGPGPVFGNLGIFDGNGGLTPFPAPGLNLTEPNPPTPGVIPDPGDNLDAWDMDAPPAFPIYFSMDSPFVEPIEGVPANTGTAAVNGFVGGDVVVTLAPGGPPVVYASAFSLGLDLIFGPDSDDLDALVIAENGIPGYQPTAGPFSWLGGTDMLLFSVRRGSALVGVPDGIFGAPISEGDVLVPLGPGFIPGIFTAAEALGLATIRSGTAAVWPTFDGVTMMFNDDLDALDIVPEPGVCWVWLGLALLRRRRRVVATA